MGQALRKLTVALSLVLIPICAARGAGPARFAAIDRSTGLSINSPGDFDRASRLEILAFTQALLRLDSLIEFGDLRTFTKAKLTDTASVRAWRTATLQILKSNYASTDPSSVPPAWNQPSAVSVEHLRSIASRFHQFLPDSLNRWYKAASAFHDDYLHELLRLASLFPRTTSEIATFGASEVTGAELPDRHFILTFDDGPTVAGGHTDTLAHWLRSCGMQAVFFVLGERLNQRVKAHGATMLEGLYDGMVVGLHGAAHNSHAKPRDGRSLWTKPASLSIHSCP